MLRIWMLGLASAGVALGASAAAAQWERGFGPGGGWVLIGERTVNRNGDVDVIQVRGRDRTSQVRLCVLNRPIRMHDFDVWFANGGHQDVRVRERIRPGTCTRAVDLKGDRRRNIDRIRLRYERAGQGWGGGRPLIQVYAR